VAPTSLFMESSQSHVESPHRQGAAPTESSQSHVESLIPQGVATTSLLRESSTSYVDSQAWSSTGSSEALDLVSRRRSTASRRQSCAPSAMAVQAREGSGEAREAPAHTAVGPERRGRRGSPDGGYPHPAPTASVRAQEGTSLVSEAAFDTALASKDPAAVQRAFDKFYGFRQRMEMEQEAPFGPTWPRRSSD
jgi:hypothetical protein